VLPAYGVGGSWASRGSSGNVAKMCQRLLRNTDTESVLFGVESSRRTTVRQGRVPGFRRSNMGTQSVIPQSQMVCCQLDDGSRFRSQHFWRRHDLTYGSLAQYGTGDLVMPEARIALMAELLTSIPCAICHRPVRLEECKADDFGRRVHEMCFAEWMIEDQKKETRKQT